MRQALALLLLCACAPSATPGTTVSMNFERRSKLWRGPIPSNDLLRTDRSVNLIGFERPGDGGFVDSMLDVIEKDSRGFSTAAPIYLPLTAAIDPAVLPDLAGSVARDGKLALIDVSPGSPEYLQRRPFSAHFMADGGPFAAPNLLVVLPLQGRPLRGGTRYAVVVQRALAGLGVSQEMNQLKAGVQPKGMSNAAFADYREVLKLLEDTDGIAGMTVFTTDQPTERLRQVREEVLAAPLPALNGPFTQALEFDDYCVYETTVDVPVYQGGTPPYFDGGGEWQTEVQSRTTANVIAMLPKKPMPSSGFPLVTYVRQGGTGKWPMVERGRRSPTMPAELGSGLARDMARAGFAAISLDGPHGGRRNPDNADEQLLIFNFLNPIALRDNIRQSALELDLLAALIPSLQIDASACGGNAASKLDAEKVVLFGHSTGAWIAPIAAAFEPRYKALVLSGAGASWVENIVHKKSPLQVRVFAEQLVGYTAIGRELTEIDPLTMLAQWAADPSDPQNYAPVDRHVMMVQGIVDTYIMPPIANAISLRLDLDLAGDPLEETLEPLLPFSGRARVALPQSQNREGLTAVVVQHPADGVEDGHETLFQREAPKYQYRCFLKTFAEGMPRVPVALDSTTVCD